MTFLRLSKTGWRSFIRRYQLAVLKAATLALMTIGAPAAQAVEIRFSAVTEGVYAFVGELGGRTSDNEGLNANIGLVVTPAGAILIDSGATAQGARQIDDAVRRVTDQPIRWVINTGGQDHRWLGNGYFKTKGADLIAHAAGRSDMQNRGNDHLAGLQTTLGAKAEGTTPTLPNHWLVANDEHLNLGGLPVEIRHRGGAHTPGDMLVWFPQQGVLFTGDVVYVERMLGVLPVSQTAGWLATFNEIERLSPTFLVPGHGKVTDLATARADTRDYLVALRAHMKQAIDDGVEIGAAIKSFDARPFSRLLNAAELMPGNASRVYLEMEAE